MLTFNLSKKKRKRPGLFGNFRSFFFIGRPLLLTGIIFLAMTMMPLHAWCGRHSSGHGADKAPAREKTVRNRPAKDADAFSSVIAHLRSYRKAVKNRRYLTIIDYSKPSSVKRMYLIDMTTGRVEKYLVSHGRNSGWAYATAFSNRPESFRSCRGFFVTGRAYSGEHGISLQLYGLDKGVNDNALRRGIVMHGANYVSGRTVRANGGRLGRSLGCPAIPTEAAKSVINRIKGGSLVYIHAGGKFCAPEGSKRAAKHRS